MNIFFFYEWYNILSPWYNHTGWYNHTNLLTYYNILGSDLEEKKKKRS